MQIHIIKTINIVITVKGSTKCRGTIVIFLHHLLMLSLGVPTHIIAQVNTAHTDSVEVVIIGIAILPYILFIQSIENRHQIVGLVPHQVMVLPIPPSHFNLVLV